jgi:hypothetical protein
MKHHHALKQADDILDTNGPSYVLPSALRDTSAPCASGDKCISAPPSRVEIRGEQCGACLRVQADMRARLKARRG